jgi:hypothetical protein
MNCNICNKELKLEGYREELSFYYCDCPRINPNFSHNTRVYLQNNIIYYYHFFTDNYFVQACANNIEFYFVANEQFKLYYKLNKFINVDNSNKLNENIRLIEKYLKLMIFT